MTEKVEQPAPEQQQEEQKQEREYSSIELKAIDQGWIPKEEFDGDPSEFIDAPEFVRRGELFEKIERQSKELKAVKQALDALKVHHTKVKETEYQRALKTLQEARKQAFLDGEHERAFAIEDKIEEVKAEREQIRQEVGQVNTEVDDSYSVEFQRWVDRNDWYESNETMRAAADGLGIKLHRQGHSPEKVLEMVEKQIRQEFSHKFKNPAASRPANVESSTRAPANKKDSFVLTDDERKIMRKFVSTGVMTETQYIDELKRTR